MSLVLDGSANTVAGLAVGGLGAGVVDTATLAAAAVTPTKQSQPLTLMTVNAGGTNPFNNTLSSLDFTPIPSWVKRITLMFNGVSLSGTADWMVRAGSSSGGIETSGYTGVTQGNLLQLTWSSGGFQLTRTATAASTYSGLMTLTNVSGNIWVCAATCADPTSGFSGMAAGTKTLSSTLDRLRIMATNGTDTFDGGSVNILYE